MSYEKKGHESGRIMPSSRGIWLHIYVTYYLLKGVINLLFAHDVDTVTTSYYTSRIAEQG